MSLQLSNFSIAADSWNYADDGVCVDITDDVYNVTTSGCCFKVGDTTVSSTFTSITDGYRMNYNPTDDFDMFLGPVYLTAVGNNDNGDFIEESFNVTSGYIVELINVGINKIDFGFNNEVLVVIRAENDASCVSTNSDAMLFETRPIENRQLCASIVGVSSGLGLSGSKDLVSYIYPQSTAFFYGNVYRVILNAKDFEGNEMTPFEFEFKIKTPI